MTADDAETAPPGPNPRVRLVVGLLMLLIGGLVFFGLRHPRLDKNLYPLNISGERGAVRVARAVEATFPDGRVDPAPWLAALRAESKLSAPQLAAFAELNLPAPGATVAGRTLTSISPLTRGAWQTYAPKAQFRLRFKDHPDLWVQAFTSEELGKQWSQGVLLSRALAGDKRPLQSRALRRRGRQVVCLNDNLARARVVCATPMGVNAMVLSAAGRAKARGDSRVQEVREQLAGILVAALPDLGPPGAPPLKLAPDDAEARAPGAGDWKAELSEVLPDANTGAGSARVAGVALHDQPLKLAGYRGAATIAYADHHDIDVVLLDKPRGDKSHARMAEDLAAMAGSPVSAFTGSSDDKGAPVVCLQRAGGTGEVNVLCGLFDPRLPMILSTRYAYAGAVATLPDGARLAAIARLQLAHQMMRDKATR